jgi:uncharacterized protein YggE
VTFVDLTALGAWLADVAEREGASVYGIEWSVSEERRREVEAEVRTEAALDALHRARAYASAVGLETVELTALDEPGLRRKDESSAGSWSGVALGRMPMAAAPAPDFDVRPDDLEVRAEVTADFTAH